MAIHVTCPSCYARFKVDDKFAGRQGPCPKCKNPIKIPGADEKVVIHEPVLEAGAKSTAGVLVLKPLDRIETKWNPLVAIAYGAGALVALLVAIVLRGVDDKTIILAIGAIAIAPPLCFAGYAMLRNDEELEPYTGMALWVRTAICSIVYALLWALFVYAYGHIFGTEPADSWQVLLLAPPFLGLGTLAAFSCYDLDAGNSFFHYALYLVVAIILRLIMGLPPVGPSATEVKEVVAAVAQAIGPWIG